MHLLLSMLHTPLHKRKTETTIASVPEKVLGSMVAKNASLAAAMHRQCKHKNTILFQFVRLIDANCVLACIDCNSLKVDPSPAQTHMRLRKEPVRPAWKPIYANRMNRVKCWYKFISKAHWIVSHGGEPEKAGYYALQHTFSRFKDIIS